MKMYGLRGTVISQLFESGHADSSVDLIKLGDAACIWESKKQASVAFSTCESKYFAMILAAKEIV